MTRTARIAAAAASGALCALAFPLPGWWPLAFIGLTPLLVALHDQRARGGTLLGLIWGLSFYLLCLRWLAPLTIGGWLALALYLALYAAAFGGLAAAILATRARWVSFALPVAWVACDWLRSWIFGGFGWGALGFTLAPAPRLLQLAAWGGVPLLTLALAGSSSALAAAWPALRARRWRAAVPALAIAAAVPLLMLIQGSIALAGGDGDGPRLRVAVIQGDLDARAKWTEDGVRMALARYPALTDQAAAAQPDLIIWPETAVPVPLDDDDPMALRLGRLRNGVQRWGAPLLFGVPEVAGRDRIHNTARFLPATGAAPPPYRKRRLVPFGEFVPGVAPLSWIPKLVPGPAMVAGDGGGPFIAGGARVGVIVCFEGVFAEEVVDRAAAADLLAVITNDGWFTASGRAQHFDIAVLRAVETRRPIARAANTGISALIDARGRVVARAADGPGFVTAELAPAAPATPYARAPDLVPLACLAATLAALAARILGWRGLTARRPRRSS
jgi:apolipoprotein N-acyltransferase